ncbi:hypothetical protein FIV42_15305 [Persicimonas caeni]|uniref:Chromosome partitioning protein ParA n=1 Tax=Persicimonas caeni TaxID=2292766 RepID=A0A4Y6PVB6_PERCE|nr:hypothetical protein [Persicimonas caeni]QDG52059.1 hypothetical protein FIV42_15305 [Persicimonas caeni]QED33280.1 hypothetical protein FRD00_15300 [Persicimonas caeni]
MSQQDDEAIVDETISKALTESSVEAPDELLEERQRLADSWKRVNDKEDQLDDRESALEQTQAVLEEEEAELDAKREKLEALADELGGREETIEEQECALEAREDAIADQEREATSREADLKQRKQEADKREADLKERERNADKREADLKERELEADAGFQKLRTQRLTELKNEWDEERKRREQALDEEIDAERTRRFEALDREIEDRRERLDEEIEAQRERADELINEREAELDRRTSKLDERENALDEREKEVQEKQQTLDREAHRLTSLEGVLEEERAQIEDKIELRAREKVEELQRQLKAKAERVEAIDDDRRRLRERVEAHEEWRERFGEREPKEVLAENGSLEGEIERLRSELSERPSQKDAKLLAELRKEKDEWRIARQQMTREIAELKAERANSLQTAAEVEQQKRLSETYKRDVQAMEAASKKLEEDVKRLRGMYDTTAERDACIGSIEMPIKKLAERDVADRPSGASELEWLEQIDTKCRESGLEFNPRLLHAFHTSMKTAEWSPLAVLTGVSGTGKSQLPKLYARFGGLQFLPLAVKPNWDSPESLFGYFNSIDNRFDATDLLRALVQSQKDPTDPGYEGGFSDRMMIVLLDEMNLAHVELYFSDLLSKLEDRRGNQEPVKKSIGLGPDVESYDVELGRNVLWAGTMNEDATTKTLSDKVLDRSNVLSFPRPTELKRRLEAKLAEPVPLIAKSTWDGWVQSRSTFTDEEISVFKQAVEHINECLQYVGRAIGHRPFQAIEHYMANHPKVIDAGVDEKEREKAMKLAFEDQVVQRIMPRLRGIETRGQSKTKCLEPIREVLTDPELSLHLENDFDIACSSGYGTFVWNSAKYLEEG